MFCLKYPLPNVLSFYILNHYYNICYILIYTETVVLLKQLKLFIKELCAIKNLGRKDTSENKIFLKHFHYTT